MGTLKTMTVVLNEQVHLLEMHCTREIQHVDFKKNTVSLHTPHGSVRLTLASPVSLIFRPNTAF